MIVRFLQDRRGNFAMMSALMLIPLTLAVGFAIDGARYYKAQAHLQDAIDTAAIAVAASDEQDKAKLLTQAADFIHSNVAVNTIEGVTIGGFEADTDEIQINSTGFIRTTFMRLANVETMPVAASTLAKRAPIREIEVALVLDNTDSMNAPDPATGESRIQTLRKATVDLIQQLLKEGEQGPVSISLVPYADHVNVGKDNKLATWLQLDGVERDVRTGSERECKDWPVAERLNVCTKYDRVPCVSVRDGISYPSMCNGQCLERTDYPATTKNECRGGYSTKYYRFHGCVGTRVSGSLRLSDESPTIRYPGFVQESQECEQPIIALTKDQPKLLAAAKSMMIKPSSRYPQTHIPSGLVWGLNVLSPRLPFNDAEPYDENNQDPRKILILMTDGDNTLKYDTSSGKHTAFKKTSDAASVDADTVALCTNIKKNGIEIYSVAFAISKSSAKAVVRDCATSSATYYDATDAAALKKSFASIVESIGSVRIAR